jgi:hypothetical protein
MLSVTLFMLAALPAVALASVARPIDIVKIADRNPDAPRIYRSLSATWSSPPAVTAPPRSPYRIPVRFAVDPTSKDRALDQDGSRCALIGQTICTDPPRVIMTIGEEPFALLPGLEPR